MHVQQSTEATRLMFCQTLRLLPYFMCANSEGSGATAWMRSLAWAFAVRLCDKYHNLISWLKCSWLSSLEVHAHTIKTLPCINWLAWIEDTSGGCPTTCNERFSSPCEDKNQNNIKYWYEAMTCNTLDVITPLIEFLSALCQFIHLILLVKQWRESNVTVIGIQSY